MKNGMLKRHTLDSVLAMAVAAGKPSFSGKGEVFFGSTDPSLVVLAGPAGVGGARPLPPVVGGRAGLLEAEVAIGTATGGAGLALVGVTDGVGLPLIFDPVLAVAPRAAAAANPPGAFRADGGI